MENKADISKQLSSGLLSVKSWIDGKSEVWSNYMRVYKDESEFKLTHWFFNYKLRCGAVADLKTAVRSGCGFLKKKMRGGSNYKNDIRAHDYEEMVAALE